MPLIDYWDEVKMPYGDRSEVCGKQVYFGDLNIYQITEYWNQGYAPGLTLGTIKINTKYLYPVNWNLTQKAFFEEKQNVN